MPSLNNGLKAFYLDGKAVRKASLDGKVFFEKHNYDLSLVSDKDILSYYDGDSATLTATLTDYNEPVAGETVVFSCEDAVETTVVNASGTYDFGDVFTITPDNLTPDGSSSDFNLKIGDGTEFIGISCMSRGSLYVGVRNGEAHGWGGSIDKIQIANKILTIWQSGNPSSYDFSESDIDLTTWYVKENNSVTVEGYFYETGVTDVNGECSVVYDSKGTGDLNIKCECMNLQEIFVLEDCISYDPLTSASGKWTIPSGVTSTYSSNGWKISANAYKQIKLTEKLTSACSVEFTVVDYSTPTSSYAPVIVYAYTNGETTPNQMIMMNYPSRIDVLGTSINHAIVKGAVYKIEYTASTIKVYENDTLLASASSSVGFPTRFEWHMGANGRYAVYKDLKAKPL